MTDKKWAGSQLVLDPDMVNQERKQSQKRFMKHRKKIKGIFYIAIGLIVITLSISLPLTLIGSSSKKDPKEYPREAVISNKNDVIVKFNKNLIREGEKNANDYKKEDLYEKIKKSMTSKITQDVYYAIISSELETFKDLGTLNTLISFVKNKIIEEEEWKAKISKQSYLLQLMKKGFGSSKTVLSDKELLKEAKAQYSMSFEMRTKAYGYLLAMIYLAKGKSKFRTAASARSLKEVWYLQTSFSGSEKDRVTKQISKNSCETLPEVPTVWGRLSLNNLNTLIKKSDLTNLYTDEFNNVEDIRTVKIDTLLNSVSIRDYFVKNIVEPKIINLVKRSSKATIQSELKKSKDKLFLNKNDINALNSNRDLAWNEIWDILYRSSFRDFLRMLKKDKNYKETFINNHLKVLNKKIDSQSDLFGYASELNLNPAAGTSDDDLRVLIKDAWKAALEKEIDTFLKTTDDQIWQATGKFSRANKLIPPVNESKELESVLSEFSNLSENINGSPTFVTDGLNEDTTPAKLLEAYTGNIIHQASDWISKLLDNTYSSTKKENFVQKYKNNLALDNNAFTWKRLSVFITRMLLNKHIEYLKSHSTSASDWVSLELNNITQIIKSWSLDKLKTHATALSIPTTNLQASALRTKIQTAWRSRLTDKINTLKNASAQTQRSTVISHLYETIPPKKDCGSLDNWNDVVLDTSINHDDKYNERRENYGVIDKRRFGYMGFIREATAPSEINAEMKKEIFKNVSGDDPFKEGLQVREDYDGVKRVYFIQNMNDKTNAVFIIAKKADVNKITFKNDNFDLDYTKNLLYSIVSTSSQYLSSARSYYFTSRKYRVFFYDDVVKGAISGKLNPNNVKNLTKNSTKDPVKKTDNQDDDKE